MPREKIIIAVCGIPDTGKSTFIVNAAKHLNGMEVQPDALCVEQQTGKTIATSFITTWGEQWERDGKTCDLVFVDCPGHMQFLPEIVAGLAAAHAYIVIHDASRIEASKAYARMLNGVAGMLGVPELAELYSHCDDTGECCYNVGIDNRLPGIAERIIKRALAGGRDKLVHPTASWLGYIRQEPSDTPDVRHKVSVVWLPSASRLTPVSRLQARLPDRTVELGAAESVIGSIPGEKDFQGAPVQQINLNFPVRYLDPVRCLIYSPELGTVGVGTVNTWKTQALW